MNEARGFKTSLSVILTHKMWWHLLLAIEMTPDGEKIFPTTQNLKPMLAQCWFTGFQKRTNIGSKSCVCQVPRCAQSLSEYIKASRRVIIEKYIYKC